MIRNKTHLAILAGIVVLLFLGSVQGGIQQVIQAYFEIKTGSTGFTPRGVLNFTSGVTCSDNSGTSPPETDCAVTSTAPSFSVITTGVNTVPATMTLGTGSSLTFSGTGIVNSNELLGATIPTLPGSASVLEYTGSAFTWATLSSLAVPFSAITSGTNITAAMTVGVGSTFEINQSGAADPALPSSTNFDVVGVSAASSRITNYAYGGTAFFTAVRADGTPGSPTALVSGDQIGGVNAFGYNGTAPVGPQASLRQFANQNWSGTANGTYVDITTTPNGSTTAAEVIRFENDAGITVPATVTGGDKGAGTINAGGLFVNGVAVAAIAIPVSLGNGGTNASLTASNGGIFYSTASAAAILAGTVTPGLALLSGATAPPTWSATAPALLGNASNTFTGQQIISLAATASTSPLYMTGAVFAGTATTSYPYVYHNVGASQPTSWNPSGTVFGANEASGYGGNFIDFHLNGGSSAFNVQSNGNVFSAANLLAGSSSHIGFNSRALLLSPADSEISLTNNAATGFTYLDLGPDANTSFIRLAVTTQANPILSILDANGTQTAVLRTPTLNVNNTTATTGATRMTLTLGAADTFSTALTTSAGSYAFGTQAGIIFKAGTNARTGTGTLVGGTLAVANTSVTSTSQVFIQDTGGGVLANIGALYVASQTAGTGFTVTSSNALDTSTFRYWIFETN